FQQAGNGSPTPFDRTLHLNLRFRY
ncbi:MAG: hypothetical protein QOK03_1178, partial [Candidatus Binataceae bacterium]|nr:hypothetical protein [Candidatus Binataceae bacterium]